MNLRRILYVHDGPEMENLRGTLEKQGYEVVPATNGAKALDVLSKQEFDGVILDSKVTTPGGYTLRSRIHHQRPDIPMLLFGSAEELRSLPLRVFGQYMKAPEAPDAVLANLKN